MSSEWYNGNSDIYFDDGLACKFIFQVKSWKTFGGFYLRFILVLLFICFEGSK